MFTKPLILSALAAVAVAQLPGPALQARALNDLDSSPSCSSARDSLMSVYSQLPTPAAILDDAAIPTDLCKEPSLTGETAKAWSSFTSEAIAVLATNGAIVASAFSACSELEGRVPNFHACATTTAASGATATPAPTGTSGSKTGSGAPAKATGTDSGSESSPSPAANAAPRVGAIFGTVLGAAGLVGVVAAF